MESNAAVILEKAMPEEFSLFTIKLQEAFSLAVREKLGISEPVPDESDVKASLYAADAEVYHLAYNGQHVGGVVLKINQDTHHNALDLFFISPEYHSLGLGLAAWRAIEHKYPETVVWETVTPYFEERNIHFYVNKCGFHIVEFFNRHHPDNRMLQQKDAENENIPGMDAYFRFQKIMR